MQRYERTNNVFLDETLPPKKAWTLFKKLAGADSMQDFIQEALI